MLQLSAPKKHVYGIYMHKRALQWIGFLWTYQFLTYAEFKLPVLC